MAVSREEEEQEAEEKEDEQEQGGRVDVLVVVLAGRDAL